MTTEQTGQRHDAGLPAALGGVDLTDLDRYTAGFPHEVFTRLRREAPVLYHPPGHTKDGEGFWVLSSHEHVAAAGSDIALFSAEGGGGRAEGGTHMDDLPNGLACGTNVNMTDDPKHQMIKDLMAPAVSGEVFAAIEEELRRRVSGIVDDALAGGSFDFQRDIAARVAVTGISLVLGLPEPDRPKFHSWTDVAMGYEDRETGKMTGRSEQVVWDMVNYAGEQFKVRREQASPRMDMLTALARGEFSAEKAGRPFPDQERQFNFALLALAGSEPVRGAMSIGMLALAERPGLWRELREDRALLPGAVEEMLRWASPTPYNRRTATADTEIGGFRIRAGEKVTLWWASANRDEKVFPDPFTFDILRQPNPHLVFGAGAHTCLGDQVGRMEMRLLFDALLDRAEAFELAGPVKWAKNNKHTVVLEMPVRRLVR